MEFKSLKNIESSFTQTLLLKMILVQILSTFLNW